MAADLPTEFDVIVLGTGMPESIVAAACSRIGQAVLHIDRNEYYSGDWASFNLQGIENWAKQIQMPDEAQGLQRPSVDESSLVTENESLIQLPLLSNSFSNITCNFHVEEGEEVLDSSNVKSKRQDQTTEPDVTESTDKSGDHASSISETESNKADQTETTNTVSTFDESKTESGEADQTETKNVASTSDESKTDCPPDSADIHKDNIDQTVSKGVKDMEINDEVANNQNAMSESAKDATGTGDMNKKGGEQNEDNTNTNCDGDSRETVIDEGGASTQEGEIKLPTAETKEESIKWTVKRLKTEWRKFNLDLSPKVIYSGGDMVELLISSDIAKYCEFKTVTRLLTILNGELEKVPCSRADVFSSKKVSMIEKRMLMKFLQFCAVYENKPEEIADFLQKPFTEFLRHKKLTANVSHYIQHSIAMATDSTTTEQGLIQMKRFIKSVGRYGNTAFLWSLYGSGELPQSFCRMCAVFGGLYCLRMAASSMIVNTENKCTGIITTEGQKISCKWLIMENSYAPTAFISQSSKRISRAIIMTDKPLLPSEQQELSLMSLPCPDDADRPIVVLELPPSSQACPKQTYIFHLTRKSNTDVKPEDDLSYAVNKLFNNGIEPVGDTPTILWSLYFTQFDMSTVSGTGQVPANVILMPGPGSDIDIDRPVREAKDVFTKILPEEEFLPKAPNPEDIIYVDDSEAQVAKDDNQSEFTETSDSQSESSSEIQGAEDNQSELNSKTQGTEDSQSEISSKTQVSEDNQSEISPENLETKDNPKSESKVIDTDQSQTSTAMKPSEDTNKDKN